MKLAIVNSKGFSVDHLSDYIPAEVTEIILAHGDGASQQAIEYAKKNQIPLQVFLPQYQKYQRYAQKEQNTKIAQYADRVLAFWDGFSPEIQHMIFYCHDIGTPIQLYVRKPDGTIH